MLNEDVLGQLEQLNKNQPGFLEQVVTMFREAAPQQVLEMQQSASSGDRQNLRTKAHALKGSSANVSLERRTYKKG